MTWLKSFNSEASIFRCDTPGSGPVHVIALELCLHGNPVHRNVMVIHNSAGQAAGLQRPKCEMDCPSFAGTQCSNLRNGRIFVAVRKYLNFNIRIRRHTEVCCFGHPAVPVSSSVESVLGVRSCYRSASQDICDLQM